MSKNLLKEHYLDASKPGSYSGLESLHRALKDNRQPVKRSKLKQWMIAQKTYTRHRSARKKYRRNKVFSSGIDHLWQIDLVDMSYVSKDNKKTKYLLTCIDVFSKHAWVAPLLRKTGLAVMEALKNIFKDGRTPKKIQTDEGTEFLNKNVTGYLKGKQIELYVVRSEMKASVVERFNRTFKGRMYRYFTANDTVEYLNIVDEIVDSYNNTYHRSIKMSPNSVNEKNENEVRNTLYGDTDEIIKFWFKIGDTVRISKYKSLFEKGYLPN